jgi:hypothetical protein
MILIQRTSKRGLCAVLALAVGACAPTGAAMPPSARVVKLLVRDGSLMVHATIDGNATDLIVDSGASYHMLAAAVARRLRLYTIGGAEGRDGLGRVYELAISESVRVRLDGWQVVHDGLGVTELPREFEQKSIAGLLSPQWLDSARGAIVLDLPALELRWLSDDEAARLFSGKTIALERCEDTYSVLLGVRVVIGGVPAFMEVDTGTTRTLADAARSVGKQLEHTATGEDATITAIAGEVRGRMVTPLTIDLAGASLPAAPVIVAQETRGDCGYDGILGTDVLRHCALLFAHGRASLSCRTPASPAPRPVLP